MAHAIDLVSVANTAVAKGALQKDAELLSLLELLADVKPRTVVEVGTYVGGTFYAWCQVASSHAFLATIDRQFRMHEYLADASRLERLRNRLLRYDGQRVLRRYARAEQAVSLLEGDSQSLQLKSELASRLDGRTIDFLFIDGDHSYQGVRNDFENFRDLMSPGGVVAFHDIVEHRPDAECEVHRAWNEIKVDYRHREIVHDLDDDRGWGPWAGIGVLYVDGHDASGDGSGAF